MNELSAIRALVGAESEPTQLGVVHEVISSSHVTVRLDTGVYRRVAGQATPAQRVTVRGEQLCSVVASVAEVQIL